VSEKCQPYPRVYTRRAVVEDVLPKDLGTIPAGQDILVGLYKLNPLDS
jgi:carotene epsilon-monooxygenase